MTGQPGEGSPPQPAELADAVEAAVLSVPGVAALHGGAFGEAATYLAGRKVTGVQLRPGTTTVHVVLTYGVPVRETADRVRAVVSAITHTPVDVVVEDVATPLETAVSRDT